jgi:hypothetical protein
MGHEQHYKKVDKLADKVLAPEEERVVIKRTARNIASEIDLYSDLVPEEMISEGVSGVEESTIYENMDAYDVFEGVVGEEILNPPPVRMDEEDRIKYTAGDKLRLLMELGVKSREPAERTRTNKDTSRKTIIEKNEKRIEPAELAAREAEKIQAELDKKAKMRDRRKHRTPTYEEKKARRAMIIIAIIILALLYGFCFIYVGLVNREDGELAAKKLRTLNQVQILTKINKTDNQVSASDKQKYNLSMYKLDSDEDGLTDYYELQFSATAPAIADSDGDGIPDGTELRAGTNPKEVMSDGVTPDADRTYQLVTHLDAVSVTVAGNFGIYGTTVDEYPLNTLNMPGLLTPAVEINFPEEGMTGTISVDLSRINAAKWGEGSGAQIYRYNPDDGSMTPAQAAGNIGTAAGNSNFISASAQSGIYFAADKNYMSADGGTNIMFVIDNSGSMYPASLVSGSEENDLEFKRIAFAEDIIERVGDDVNFGVGKFTMQYNTLIGVTDNDKSALAALDSIRTVKENFDGTEISNSIIRALSEFDNNKFDRNYIIAITDGLPSIVNKENEQRAIDLAREKNVSVITIGLGKKIDADFLSVIAAETGGVYYQAVNNSTFDIISEKIEELLSRGRTTVIDERVLVPSEDGLSYTESTVGELKVLLLADSGFLVKEDTLAFKDVPTNYDPNGSDLGLAVFAKLYYSGDLPLSAAAYTTNSYVDVAGYNLSGSAFYTTGKQNLSELHLPISDSLSNYKTTIDRWDFTRIRGGLVPLSDTALRALASLEGYYSTEIGTYEWTGGERPLPGFMRTITFQHPTMFSDYEYAAINIDALESEAAKNDEYQTLRAVNYYNSYDDKGGVVWLSFGIDGKAAFDELETQLTLGKPAVLVAGGRAYNAARLSRSQEDPTLYIIEAYDPTDAYGMSTIIRLSATALYNSSGGYQYTANLLGETINLYILKDQG